MARKPVVTPPVPDEPADMSDAELEAAIPGYAELPESTKAELAAGRATRRRLEAHLAQHAVVEPMVAPSTVTLAPEPEPEPELPPLPDPDEVTLDLRKAAAE